jgi:hypothetical protein
VLGRTFTEADDTRSGGPDGAVAVISHGFWQRRFGGDPDVVGRSLTIERTRPLQNYWRDPARLPRPRRGPDV